MHGTRQEPSVSEPAVSPHHRKSPGGDEGHVVMSKVGRRCHPTAPHHRTRLKACGDAVVWRQLQMPPVVATCSGRLGATYWTRNPVRGRAPESAVIRIAPAHALQSSEDEPETREVAPARSQLQYVHWHANRRVSCEVIFWRLLLGGAQCSSKEGTRGCDPG